MTYFEDLSLSTHRNVPPSFINVGWLDKYHPYPKGRPSYELVKKTWTFCKTVLKPYRGFHACNLCETQSSTPFIARFEGEELPLGYAQFCVFSKGKKIFYCPNLIFHYIVDHEYAPPNEFKDALMNGYEPESEEYKSKMDQLFSNNWNYPLVKKIGK